MASPNSNDDSGARRESCLIFNFWMLPIPVRPRVGAERAGAALTNFASLLPLQSRPPLSARRHLLIAGRPVLARRQFFTQLSMTIAEARNLIKIEARLRAMQISNYCNMATLGAMLASGRLETGPQPAQEARHCFRPLHASFINSALPKIFGHYRRLFWGNDCYYLRRSRICSAPG